jgi:hypothetical protein
VIEPATKPHRWDRDARVVLRAVFAHPSLWWTAAGTVLRLARPGWWRRAPFLPLPAEDYWRFRLVTAYGGDGEAERLTSVDVVDYLRWCRKARPGRG